MSAKKVVPVKKPNTLRNEAVEIDDHTARIMNALATEKPYHGKNPTEKGYVFRCGNDGNLDWYPDYDNRPDLHPLPTL